MKHNNTRMNMNEQKNAAWFIENGYTDPGALIDFNAELDEIGAFAEIFAAYNQHNIAAGTPWNNWPDWELCLTSMNSDLHFVDQERDPPEIIAHREHWLLVMQLIHDHEAVSYEGYTITIQGNHGHTFSFDFGLEIEAWGSPGTYAGYKARLEANAKKPKAWMWRREGYVFEHHIGIHSAPIGIAPNISPYTGGGEPFTRQTAVFAYHPREKPFLWLSFQ